MRDVYQKPLFYMNYHHPKKTTITKITGRYLRMLYLLFYIRNLILIKIDFDLTIGSFYFMHPWLIVVSWTKSNFDKSSPPISLHDDKRIILAILYFGENKSIPITIFAYKWNKCFITKRWIISIYSPIFSFYRISRPIDGSTYHPLFEYPLFLPYNRVS